MAKLAGSPDTHYAKSSPFDRICFGSDVPIPEMGSCLKAYQRLFDALHLPEEVRRRVMGESVAAMFGLKG
jgi:predicted TIM-barrel fold metal-dependent hydrolase